MLQSRAGFIKQYKEIKQNWARPENFDTSCSVLLITNIEVLFLDFQYFLIS